MHRLVWLCGLAFSYLPTPFIALVTFFFLSAKEPGSIKTFLAGALESYKYDLNLHVCTMYIHGTKIIELNQLILQ